MMPLSLFGSRRFVGITLLTLLLYGALGGFFVLVPYVLTQDRETIRHQHGRARSLHETSCQQDGKSRRHRASQRSKAEQQNARNQETAAAVPVSRGSSQQKQRAQGKQVSIDNPLQAGGIRLKT